jgi:hypothetical protein
MKMKRVKRLAFCLIAMSISTSIYAQKIDATLLLKTPGNPAVTYPLHLNGSDYTSSDNLPVKITRNIVKDGDDDIFSVRIRAYKKVFFNFGAVLSTGMKSDDDEFYLPGFWYHLNMRSPQEAPSFKTSKSWNFREDRLSTPLTSVYCNETKEGISVVRILDNAADVQTQLTEGDVILPGKTSVGYLGFDNESENTKLTFGYPYVESPKRYIRKLVLAPYIRTFAQLNAGDEQILQWRIHHVNAESYGDFVAKLWKYSFDKMMPQTLDNSLSADEVKEHLCNYFRKSYVDIYPLKYNSGLSLRTSDCKPMTEVQIGFCGRVLLNAFNEIEYGDLHHDIQLKSMGYSIMDSFLKNGFTEAGYFIDFVNFKDGFHHENIHSIRQQSEAVYAILHYLKYEKAYGRKHPEWEKKIQTILNNFLEIQKADGHFARKYKDDGSDIDTSGGSTPSATSALVMGWKYFGNKAYLNSAKRTVKYVENNIISKSDYFSSTLDANCEDKEAAIAAVTSTYYMAMVTQKDERKHYIDLCKQAAYFALSWYYTWDVPFAEGQMLGDVHFRSRGWGNVSVENNHIDVFVFELPHIIKWLAKETGEDRFTSMYNVISSSLSQLMPTENRHCGIAEPGFYPEVVQHTTWDYGRNGKGFYNNIFAPGWTVASLWELYSPNRTADFLR